MMKRHSSETREHFPPLATGAACRPWYLTYLQVLGTLSRSVGRRRVGSDVCQCSRRGSPMTAPAGWNGFHPERQRAKTVTTLEMEEQTWPPPPRRARGVGYCCFQWVCVCASHFPLASPRGSLGWPCPCPCPCPWQCPWQWRCTARPTDRDPGPRLLFEALPVAHLARLDLSSTCNRTSAS